MTRRLVAAMILSALCGYLSLSYEIVWYRIYSFTSGGRASALGLFLCAYLVGIAFGSLACRAWCRKRDAASDAMSVQVLSRYLLVANALAFLLVPAVAQFVARAHVAQLTLPLVALAMSFMGAVFPLVAHVSVPPDDDAGAALSRLYMANIAGSALGTLVTGLVLLDVWPLRTIAVFLGILGVATGALLLRGAGLTGRRLVANVAAYASIAAALPFAAPVLYDGIYEKLQWKTRYEPDERFAHVVENRSGIITVDRRGVVYGDGAFDGAYTTDIGTTDWIVRAYAVAALHARPRRVLMIGLGSGSWATVVANHPAVESLSIVEINPGHAMLVPKYPAVAGLLSDPKVDLIIDDGRRWLKNNPDRKFDLVVANTRIHWRSGSTHVLSAEFLEQVRRNLAPGGILYYNATSSPRVQRTGASVFPHALRVDNFMAVSDAPIEFDRNRWREVLAGYSIYGKPVFDLSDESSRLRMEAVVGMQDALVSGSTGSGLEERASILARTEGLRIVTDDNMGTEWGAR